MKNMGKTINKGSARDEIKQLSQSLEKHNHFYYVLDKPQVSDAEYDRMLRRLQELEMEHSLPGFKPSSH